MTNMKKEEKREGGKDKWKKDTGILYVPGTFRSSFWFFLKRHSHFDNYFYSHFMNEEIET